MKKNVHKMVLLAVLLGVGVMAPVCVDAKEDALPQVQQMEARGGNGGGHFAPGNRDRRMPQPARPMPAPQPGPEFRPEPMPAPMPEPMPAPMPEPMPAPMPEPMPAPMPAAPIVITIPGIHILIGG